jgi:hypothetical protein
MAQPQWARLQSDASYPLRRGAWYRIAQLDPSEAMLDVNRRPVPVPRTSLKIVSAPPRSWTVVTRPRNARGLPATWGARYAVCPGCRNRVPLRGAPQSMHCPRCDWTYRVAWEEWFIGRD